MLHEEPMAQSVSSFGRKALASAPPLTVEQLRAWAPLAVSLVISLAATLAWMAGQHPLQLLLAVLAQ
jgi:hypothetical protein